MERFFQKISLPFSRFAIFLVYFWFGILKVFDESPANPLVSELLGRTMPFMSFETFIICFGIFEMLIGILFLVPKFTKPVMLLLAAHLAMITMPLFLLPEVAWQGFLVPTMEGQYIIKNILIVAAAIFIFAFNGKNSIWQSSTSSQPR
ncbi:hypothetical protein A2738_01230 [Candidatus Nomurabacteria bacterium RIFCSPHIGHO2_01_FULL_42_15]|uniref:DoxX family protein n=1 Tax=Candidatus Nomurabacteria bacterium RIFCSPHIGHO2_01_FULL_42_15 TaxID=1801742 RepID=A0A1F6VFY1_9BACT|nr:MAG: hypothetical protein A2738_01230 [Candidatus Nomurabacteria bacterium RIFCSPHIGHO2_01_FULL_42_15]OGI93086.1 MAG: hypothetical protein A3A99_00940 [Candidatus Nomurabacteria bacterium RIFCSPLOWO2_01_FULL_41_18]